MASMESKQNQLEELSQSIKQYEAQFSALLQTIGWTREKLHIDNHTPKFKSTKRSSRKRSHVCVPYADETEPLIDVRSREEKLEAYEKCLNELGHFTEPELSVSVNESRQYDKRSAGDKSMTFAEITKLKRDQKRRRMKYRTTKAPPLTHSEEIRSLISLQMESWQQYLKDKSSTIHIN